MIRTLRNLLLALVAPGAASVAIAQMIWVDGTGNSNWSNAANWATAIPGPADVARFDTTTAKSPNISGNATVGELVLAVGTDAESFTGSKILTLEGIGGVGIDNQTGLIHTFANKFALGADQTWQSTIDGGGLVFNGVTDLATHNLTLDLATSGAASITFGGKINGAGSNLSISGNGTVSLGATGNYTGSTTINSGATLQIVGSGTLSASADVMVNAGGTYDLNGISDTISTIAGSGNITLGSAVLKTTGAGSTTVSGVISDGGAGGSLDKRGAGTLTLSGANSFTGGVLLNAGSIAVGNDSALGTGTLDLSGGTLTTTADRTLANALTMSGSSTMAAGPGISLVFSNNSIAPTAGTLTLDNTADAGAHLSVGFSGSGGSFAFGQGIALDDAATDLALLNTSGVQTFSGRISGAGNVVRDAAGGTTVLATNNTFTGNLSLLAGTVQVSADNQLGATPGAATPGQISFDGGALNATASFTVSGNRGISLDAGGGTLAVDAGMTLSYGGVIAGTGNLTKEGDGTLTLNGSSANTQTGDTLVSAGTLELAKTGGMAAISGNLFVGDGTGTDTLRLDGSNQIGDTATLTLGSSGVFDVNGNTETVGGLAAAAGGAQVQLGSGSLTIDNAGTETYAGSINGTGTLAKAGAGRLTLTGSSASFSGATSVDAGIVNVQSGDALGTSTVAVAGGANLEVQGGLTLANTFTLAGPGAGAGDGALENVADTNTVSGAIVLAADARIQSSADRLDLSGGITGSGHTVTFGGVGDISVTGMIATGGGGLVKDGAGTLHLGSASGHSFGGPVTIGGGSVVMAAANQFNNAAALTIASGATLALASFSQTVGSLAGTGALDFGGVGTGQLTLGHGSATFGGSFAGAGTIIIGAGATLTLGSDFYAPGVNFTLAGGTLALNGTTSTFGLLSITGASVLDFGNSSASVLTVNDVTFQNTGLALTVSNWANLTDLFYALNFTGATPDGRGSAPENQVAFDGFSSATTVWQSLDRQVTPVPEPAASGLAMLLAAVGLVGWRRWRSRT